MANFELIEKHPKALARELFSGRGSVAISFAEINAQMKKLLGFDHRDIVGDCPGYKTDMHINGGVR